MDSEMAPEPTESLDHVRSGAFDGDLSDLTPPYSPQREDSVTGGMQTPLGHDKLVNIFDVTHISKDKYQYTVHCPDNTQEFHEDLEGSLVVVAFWNEFKGGRSAMKINEKRVATKEFVDRRRDAFLDVEGTLNVEEVNKPRADIGPRKCLVGARIEKGQLEYMLWWFSYVENEATWEPAENVTAEVLVSRFWRDVGMTPESFSGEGNFISPSSDFIEESKEFFLRTPTRL
ncbi:hypothetical protein BJV77DRAFT_1072936 [Russula vinacea]|nr:hypothetical protein BJV77DRAFT_1072936 [Russula vinacea]